MGWVGEGGVRMKEKRLKEKKGAGRVEKIDFSQEVYGEHTGNVCRMHTSRYRPVAGTCGTLCATCYALRRRGPQITPEKGPTP